MKTFKTYCEEMGAGTVPANTVGGGHVEGTGVGPKGEPGRSKKKSPVIQPIKRRFPKSASEKIPDIHFLGSGN